MNLEFVFVVFCLTVLALVSIAPDKDYLAEKAINAISSLAQQVTASVSDAKRLWRRKNKNPT